MPNKLKDIDPNQLMLWKRVITTKESKNLKLSELEDDDQLDATWEIGKYFTGDPPVSHLPDQISKYGSLPQFSAEIWDTPLKRSQH